MLRTKAALLLLCLLFAPMVAQAQDPNRGWQWQNPLPQGNSISAIRFSPDKKRGWAVGSNGVVLTTNNGGFEWEEQETPANTTLYGLYIKDRSRIVITGARGVVLTTNNGGEKWVLRPSGVRDHLFAVTFAPKNPLLGWAVGTFGSIIATTDGGKTWKSQTSQTNSHLFQSRLPMQRTASR